MMKWPHFWTRVLLSAIAMLNFSLNTRAVAEPLVNSLANPIVHDVIKITDLDPADHI